MTRFRPLSYRTTALSLLASLALGGAAFAEDLRINMAADPAMIDPIAYSELNAGDVVRNMYEAFTKVGPEGQVEPNLALSWEPLTDGPGFRFTLRPGVKFHSGREFTAKDVKFSFEQLLLPGNKVGLNGAYMTNIVGAAAIKDGSATSLSGVEIIDDHTVIVRLETPDVLFPIYPVYMMDSGIIDEAGADWMTKVSAGTGPFRYSDWQRGQHLYLTAHADYWGGAPTIDGVKYLIVPDTSTAVSMYEAGDLDILLSAGLVRLAKADPALEAQLVTAPTAQVRYLAMNADHYEPFKDRRVREAVCLSLDQDEQIEGLYQGAAVRLNGQITPGVAGYDPTLPDIKYDPEKAKALIAEAGYPGGAGLPPVKLTNIESGRTQHLYFAAKLEEVIGMKAEVEIVERGTMLSAMNARQLPFYAWGWSAGYPDGLYFLKDLWYGPSAFNKGWQNPEFDALIDEARSINDPATRYELYHKAERVLLDDWGACPLPVVMLTALIKPEVEGVVLSPFRLQSFAAVTINR